MFVKVSAFYGVLIISFCGGVLLADKTSFNSFMPSLTPIHYMHNLCLHAHARTRGARSCARAHTLESSDKLSLSRCVANGEAETCSRQVWGSNNDGPKTTPSTAVAGAGTRGGDPGTPGPRDGGFVAQKASGGLPTVDVETGRSQQFGPSFAFESLIALVVNTRGPPSQLTGFLSVCACVRACVRAYVCAVCAPHYLSCDDLLCLLWHIFI